MCETNFAAWSNFPLFSMPKTSKSQKNKSLKAETSQTNADHTPKASRRHSQIASPEDINNDEKRVKNSRMEVTRKDFRELIEEVQKMHSSIGEVKDEVRKLTVEVSTFKAELKATNDLVAKINQTQKEQAQQLQYVSSSVNQIQQQLLSNQMSLHNLPATITIQEFKNDMQKWAAAAFDSNAIKKINIATTKDKTSSSAYLTFWSEVDKFKLFNNIKQKQKDNQGRYIPLLVEQIFTLKEDDVKRGTQINIRTPMTAINREIFNYLRKEGKAKYGNVNVWIPNGLVHFRTNDSNKVVVVESMSKAKQIVNQQ